MGRHKRAGFAICGQLAVDYVLCFEKQNTARLVPSPLGAFSDKRAALKSLTACQRPAAIQKGAGGDLALV